MPGERARLPGVQAHARGMPAGIADGAARRGEQKREEMAAERKAEEKCKADATKALKKLQAATTPDELSDALRRGTRLKAYLPELKKAIPEAENRLKEMTANAENVDVDEFLARVEAAAKRGETGARVSAEDQGKDRAESQPPQWDARKWLTGMLPDP